MEPQGSYTFRGEVHEECKLKLRKIKDLPVLFHNLQEYDGHLIFQNLLKVEGIETPSVIPKSIGNFVTFSIGAEKFKDSLNFLPTSLDKLVDNLKTKGNGVFNDKWGHLTTPEKIEILTRKEMHPCGYMDLNEKFEEETFKVCMIQKSK